MSNLRAHQVFLKNNADVTSAYYDSMKALGPRGELAIALMRALKRSKHQTGFGFRRISKRKTESYQNADAYDWAITELTRVLLDYPDLGFTWGWAGGFLYVMLPTGNVRFNCEDRGLCPDYPNLIWCECSVDLNVIQFCDAVADEVNQVRTVRRVIRPQFEDAQ